MLTETRAKQMDDPAYWEQFARGVLAAGDRPTPAEAAAYVARQRAEIDDWKRELAAAKRNKELVKQSFGDFVEEVERLALKHRPSA